MPNDARSRGGRAWARARRPGANFRLAVNNPLVRGSTSLAFKKEVGSSFSNGKARARSKLVGVYHWLGPALDELVPPESLRPVNKFYWVCSNCYVCRICVLNMIRTKIDV